MNNKNDSPVLYQEDTQTPTNLNTTAQAPVTTGDDGVILDQYKDPNIDNQYATKPNTTTETSKSSTGSGLSAAKGTTYSWDTKAEERAGLDYETAVLESKSNYLTNRQELESQGQQMQNQVAMNQYSKNQSAEKAGWTGGYVLDTERQMAYLKQTIQSQMYGQMELQKYGYDTSLAAARLAYDTNKYDLALEYYNTALSRAVSEAEITGYYVSPETSEMLNEYSIASRILNDDTASAEDKQRADKVIASVYEWFEANGISKQGVETYSHLVEERTHKMSIDKLYEYQNDAQNQISTDTFVKVDENGNKVYGDTTVETINFDKMSATDIVGYIYKSDGTINEVARDQYLSRLDSISYEMENNFTSWCKTQGYIDSETNKADNTQDYKALLTEYLANENISNQLANEISKLSGNTEDAEHNYKVKEIIEGWEVSIQLPDNTFVTLSAKAQGKDLEPIEPDISTYLKEYNGKTYLKDCKNANQLIQLLESNEIGVITSLLDLDFSSEKALTDSLNNWSTYAKDIPYINGLTNNLNILTDTFTVMGIDGITSLIDAPKFKKIVETLSSTIADFKETIGETNFNLMKSQADALSKLSDKDKAFMDPAQLQTMEACARYIDKIEKMENYLDYAKKYDSNIFSDPWDYIGDSWAQIGSVWDDGYQFGDVTKSVVQGIGAVGKTIGGAIVGGVKWLFGFK